MINAFSPLAIGFLPAVSILLLTSCVPTRRLKSAEAQLQSVRNDSAMLAAKVHDLQSNVAQLEISRSETLKQQGRRSPETIRPASYPLMRRTSNPS